MFSLCVSFAMATVAWTLQNISFVDPYCTHILCQSCRNSLCIHEKIPRDHCFGKIKWELINIGTLVGKKKRRAKTQCDCSLYICNICFVIISPSSTLRHNNNNNNHRTFWALAAYSLRPRKKCVYVFNHFAAWFCRFALECVVRRLLCVYTKESASRVIFIETIVAWICIEDRTIGQCHWLSWRKSYKNVRIMHFTKLYVCCFCVCACVVLCWADVCNNKCEQTKAFTPSNLFMG